MNKLSNQNNQNSEKKITPLNGTREAGMLVTAASQGTGKTYQNMIVIVNAVKDKIDIGVKGRKVLILDTNGEYTLDQFEKNGHNNFKPKTIAVKDVQAWCLSNIIDCRRIDMKSLHINDKLKILSYVMQVMRNCLIILEDINTITTDINHMKNIVSSIVNLRHKGVDVIISYQSLRAVEPRILSNCRWIRLHYSLGDVSDINKKLNEPEMTKIAQLIINERYYNGDKRFLLYIHQSPPKLKGDFTKDEFMDACKKFLLINKRKVKEHMNITGCSQQQAIDEQSEQLFDLFYGNNDKDK
jgi:hypothetical protein